LIVGARVEGVWGSSGARRTPTVPFVLTVEGSEQESDQLVGCPIQVDRFRRYITAPSGGALSTRIAFVRWSSRGWHDPPGIPTTPLTIGVFVAPRNH